MSGREVRDRLAAAVKFLDGLPRCAPWPNLAEATVETATLTWRASRPGAASGVATAIYPAGEWRWTTESGALVMEADRGRLTLVVVDPEWDNALKPRTAPILSTAEVEAVPTGGIVGDDTATVDAAEACAQCDADTGPQWDIPGASGLSDRERAELRADR